MAALDFPASPSLNQQYSTSNAVWKWNGSAWIRIGSTSPGVQGAAGAQGAQGVQGAVGDTFWASSTAGLSTTSDVTITGELTYEDVKNVDAVGIVTARDHIKITTDNKSLYLGASDDFQLFHNGSHNIIKSNNGNLYLQDDSYIEIGHPNGTVAAGFIPTGATNLRFNGNTKLATNNTGVTVTGTVAATSYTGDGSNLTSLPAQATIANNADNRVITGGSGVNLNGESNLTFNGTRLSVTGNVYVAGSQNAQLTTNQLIFDRAGYSYIDQIDNAGSLVFRVTSSNTIGLRIDSNAQAIFGSSLIIPDAIQHEGDLDCKIRFPGTDTISFETASSERLRITSAGKTGIGIANPNQPVSIAGRVSIDVNNDYYGVWADGSTTGENHISVGRWYNTGGGLKSGYTAYGINNLILENNHPTANHHLIIQPTGQKVSIGTHLVTDELVNIDGDVNISGDLKTNNLPGNNLIHNGEFAIWQRGTATIYSSQNKYLADRFKFVSNSEGNGAVHQHTNVPTVAQTGGSKFAYSLRLNCTTADTSLANNQYINLSTRIEGQDLRHLGFGETGTRYATLSFWQRSTSGTYHVSFRNSAYNRYYIASYTAANNTWEKHELTIPVDTTGTWVTNNTAGLDITWSLGGGSWYNQGTVGSWQGGSSHAGSSQKNFFDSTSNDFYITGVQFEKGSIATPFEHKSYGEDLRLCQRYYQRWKRGYLAANSVGTSDINIGIPLLVPLRTVPTIPALTMHRSGNKTITVTIVSYEYSDVNSMILELRVGGWTGGNAVVDEVAYVLIPSGDTMELIADL